MKAQRFGTTASPSSSLTRREREILDLVAEGMTNSQVAERLWISGGTVRRHLENVYAKLGVHTRTAAVHAVLQGGHMPSYLVEIYVPRAGDAHTSGRRARAAAEEMSHGGVPILFVRATTLPDDETCLHLVEASSAAEVGELCRLAGLERVRIVPAVES